MSLNVASKALAVWLTETESSLTTQLWIKTYSPSFIIINQRCGCEINMRTLHHDWREIRPVNSSWTEPLVQFMKQQLTRQLQSCCRAAGEDRTSSQPG